MLSISHPENFSVPAEKFTVGIIDEENRSILFSSIFFLIKINWFDGSYYLTVQARDSAYHEGKNHNFQRAIVNFYSPWNSYRNIIQLPRQTFTKWKRANLHGSPMASFWPLCFVNLPFPLLFLLTGM